MASKTARAVRANLGIQAAYRKALQGHIAEMHRSFRYWLTAAYKKYPPRMVDLAHDAAPSTEMKRILADLGKRWQRRFDELAPTVAKLFIGKQFDATDRGFQKALKDAGLSVSFKMTPTMVDALQASLYENVGLIRRIPAQYLERVEGAVMRTYTKGRDLEQLVQALQKIYPAIGNRAVLIARDQSNKANGVVNRARSLELGITEAIWMHSGAGKVPRPSHVKAGKDKLKYNIVEGAFIDGKYILPGEEINCRCTSKPVLTSIA